MVGLFLSGFHFFSFDGDSGVGPKAPKYCVCFLHPFYTPPKNGTTLGLFEKQYSFMLLSYLQSFANQGANGSKWGILPDLRCKTIALPLS